MVVAPRGGRLNGGAKDEGNWFAAAAQNWFAAADHKCFWANVEYGHAWHAEQRPQLKNFKLAMLGFIWRHKRESCKG
jgi:hypothetical protein